MGFFTPSPTLKQFLICWFYLTEVQDLATPEGSVAAGLKYFARGLDRQNEATFVSGTGIAPEFGRCRLGLPALPGYGQETATVSSAVIRARTSPGPGQLTASDMNAASSAWASCLH